MKVRQPVGGHAVELSKTRVAGGGLPGESASGSPNEDRVASARAEDFGQHVPVDQ